MAKYISEEDNIHFVDYQVNSGILDEIEDWKAAEISFLQMTQLE